ncbi:MAG: hypothetical protein GXO87_02270 [Chlorobi bacterium]|nr:hypothetical protein [Chlorobiota bacterium]
MTFDVSETILNIYLVIEKDYVTGFRAKAYKSDEGDNQKIEFLKNRAKEDFNSAYRFDAPQNDRKEFMKYKSFSKLESKGMHFQLFEEIFQKFEVPENPLICVTPVVDGEIISEY